MTTKLTRAKGKIKKSKEEIKIQENDILFIESSRKIFLTGVVDDDNITEVITTIQLLEEESDEDIDIYINSDGGNAWSAFALCDIIRTSKCKINTYALGRACSAASLILAMGTGRRYAYRSTRIMIHEVSWDISGKVSNVEVQLRELKAIQGLVVQSLSDATGKSVDDICRDMQVDYWMSAEEALEYGLIDEVI